MPELKRTIKVFGVDTPVTDVPVSKTLSEHFSEYELEDGSVLRIKNVPNSILRVDGQFNADGRPVYLVYMTPVVSVISSLLSSDGLKVN